MKTVCKANTCAGCMLCSEICGKNAIKIEDKIESYNAVIDESKCVNCNLCHNKCPQNSDITKYEPLKWYQGWNSKEEERLAAPSGGVGMAIVRSFIKSGGYVCSCVFENGSFVFKITNDIKTAEGFSGSKYVKSNPYGIYKSIRKILSDDKKVLFIGLPCQVAAIKSYVGSDLSEKLTTIDLICHGTPSPILLETFLNQYKKSLKTINEIAFRIKAKMQIVTDDDGIVCKGVTDKYTIGFLNGLTYTENCYSCKYATSERVSDITIGDSWGSNLHNEHKKGISLMLIQSQKGMELIEKSNIVLKEVDLQNAINHNEQLSKPMRKPSFRKDFFDSISTYKFNRLISKYYRKQCIKQDVKYILIKMGIVK